MIYLDNNATTRPAPEALAAAQPFLDVHFANPSSPHSPGRLARDAVELARRQCASAFGCRESEIIFTSGGSESIATAFAAALSSAQGEAFHRERRAIVISAVEHSYTLGLTDWYASRGYEIRIVPVDRDGSLDLDALDRALNERVALFSLIWVNNETGVISPASEAARHAKAAGALVHLDAVQAAGKVPVNLAALDVDFASVSAHKFHGLKGAGFLYVRGGTRFQPLAPGGHHERGRRAGTENVPAIVAMGAAANLTSGDIETATARLRILQQRLESALQSNYGARINGSGARRVACTTSASFPGMNGEVLIAALDNAGIAVSTGAACTTGRSEPSHVLLAMGLDESQASNSLRISMSRDSTGADIEALLVALREPLQTAARPVRIP